MAGLGMLGASRLSSIWAGRCAKGENDDTKSQISIRGSIHGARSVTSCEKANFMVCFQEAGKRPRRDFVSFLSSASCPFCYPLSLFFLPPIEPFLCLRCLAVRKTQSANVFSLLACTHTHTQPPCTWRRTNTYARSNLYLLSMVNAYV